MTARSRALAVCVAAAASCGRIDFDAGRDAHAVDGAGSGAGADSGAFAQAVLVGSAAQEGEGDGLTVAAAIPSSQVLVVAVTSWDTENVVTSITDGNGDALTSAGVRATEASVWSELWYASPNAASDGVTVAMSGSSAGFDVWIAAFSGVAIGAPATTASGCLEYPPALVAEPVTTTEPNELVVDVSMFAAPMYVDGVAAPFLVLGPDLTGNGAAYYVAPEPGNYAPAWTIGSGAGMAAMTCASAAAFLPAP